MQKDMHYYGTYAMAVAAGIPARDAATIAYASQFTDDSTRYDSGTHDDGGMLFGITTAHHPAQSLIRGPADHLNGLEEQRKIWVPFHFLPGGKGDSFHEKLLCVKDSEIVREMLENHLSEAQRKAYALELMGICAHVYADTFSHYGFSGMSSQYNKVASELSFIHPPKPKILTYIKDKMQRFADNLVGTASAAATADLGHASVATMPDRPYLHWKFSFLLPRPENGVVSERDNRKTFFEACEKLYGFFCRFAKQRYAESSPQNFFAITPTIRDILALEGDEAERVRKWKDSGLAGGIPEYFPEAWENQKNQFSDLRDSSVGIETNAYRFHQAAAYHRYYVLKDLLPAHGIAVY